MEYKKCSKCKNMLPLSWFHKDKTRKDGTYPLCGFCYNERKRTWAQNNPDKIAQKNKNYRDSNPTYMAEYRKQKPRGDRSLEYKKYRLLHPDEIKEKKHRRKAMQRAATIEQVSYAEIIKRDGYVCHICGGNIKLGDAHFDHIVPLSKGGAHSAKNIALAHSACNLKKGDRIQ